MTLSFKSYVVHSHTIYITGNIDVRNLVHLFIQIVYFTVNDICFLLWKIIQFIYIYTFAYTFWGDILPVNRLLKRHRTMKENLEFLTAFQKWLSIYCSLWRNLSR